VRVGVSPPASLLGLNPMAPGCRRGKGGSAETPAPPPRFPTEAFLLFHVVCGSACLTQLDPL